MDKFHSDAALHLLDYNSEWPIDLGNLPADDQLEVQRCLKREFAGRVPRFRQNIQYLSDSFTDKFLEEVRSRKKPFPPDRVRETGVFILNGRRGFKGTIFYDIDASIEFPPGSDQRDRRLIQSLILFVVSSRQGKYPKLFALVHNGKEHPLSIHPENIGPDQVMAGILGLLLYKRDCEVETKYVDPRQIPSEPLSAKPASEESIPAGVPPKDQLPVEVLDSRWYTTTIQTKGVLVGAATGGFFRMQPCGKENKDRKRTWIQAFTRKPQVIKAKVLTQKIKKND
jgi:hypothetical protein